MKIGGEKYGVFFLFLSNSQRKQKTINLLLRLNDLSLETLGRGNIDSLDVGEKLLLSTLLVVSLSRDADSDSVRNALDTTLPELLVQLGVESDIRGTKLLLSKVLDSLDSTGSSLLELNTEDLNNNISKCFFLKKNNIDWVNISRWTKQ